MPNNILNLMIKKKKQFQKKRHPLFKWSDPDGASKKRRLAVDNAQTTEFKSYCIVTSREFLEVVVVTGIMLDALTMALSHYLQNYTCHTKPPQKVLDLYRKNVCNETEYEL